MLLSHAEGRCDFFKSIVKAITSVVKAIVNVIKSVVSAIWNAIVAVVKWIGQALKAIWDWFKDILDWILLIIIIIILIVISYYTGYGWEYIGAVIEWFFGFDAYVSFVYFLDGVAYAWTTYGFWATVSYIGSSLVTFAGWALSSVGTWLGMAWNVLVSWVGTAAATVWDAAKAVGSGLGSAAKWLAGVVSDNPGLTALGLAAAAGGWDWLMDNWQLIAIGGVAYLALKDKGSGSGKTTIINQIPEKE